MGDSSHLRARAGARRLLPDLTLVRTNQSFRRLFVAAAGSGIGTWFATVALQIDVYGRTHQSPAWVAALLIANTLPMVIVGFLLGSLVDRLPRRRLAVGADVVRALVFAAIPFVGSASAIVALAFVSGVASAFFRPAVLAGLPNAVSEDELPLANGLLQASDYFTTMIGPIAGAALVAATSPAAAYAVNSASFVFSAVLLLGIPAHLMQSEQSLSKGHLSDLKEGLRVVARSPALLTVLIAFSIAAVPMALMNVAEIALAKRTLDSGSLGFGMLWTASGLGLVVGSVLSPRIIGRLGKRRVYPLSLAFMAVGQALTGAAPDIWVACATMVVCGLGNANLMVCNITLVQNGAPDRVRGRAFTTIISTNITFSVLGMVLAGPLTAWGGARWTYELGAIGMALAAVVGGILVSRVRDEPTELPDDEPLPAVEEPVVALA